MDMHYWTSHDPGGGAIVETARGEQVCRTDSLWQAQRLARHLNRHPIFLDPPRPTVEELIRRGDEPDEIVSDLGAHGYRIVDLEALQGDIQHIRSISGMSFHVSPSLTRILDALDPKTD